LLIRVISFLLHYAKHKFIYWILEQWLLLCPSWCSLEPKVPYYRPPKGNNFLVLTTLVYFSIVGLHYKWSLEVLTTFGLWFVEAISQTITFYFVTKILELRTYKFNFKIKMKLSSNVIQLNVLGLDVIVNTFIYMLFFFFT
jgi:hypothetical protein